MPNPRRQADGAFVGLVVNNADSPATLTFPMSLLGRVGPGQRGGTMHAGPTAFTVRDLWAHKDLGVFLNFLFFFDFGPFLADFAGLCRGPHAVHHALPSAPSFVGC